MSKKRQSSEHIPTPDHESPQGSASTTASQEHFDTPRSDFAGGSKQKDGLENSAVGRLQLFPAEMPVELVSRLGENDMSPAGSPTQGIG